MGAGSAQADGRQLALISSDWTLLHTSTNKPGMIDEVVIYGCNIDTVLRTVTLGWGGKETSAEIKMDLYPHAGRIPIVSGRISGGLPIFGKADADNVVNCAVKVDTTAQEGS